MACCWAVILFISAVCLFWHHSVIRQLDVIIFVLLKFCSKPDSSVVMDSLTSCNIIFVITIIICMDILTVVSMILLILLFLDRLLESSIICFCQSPFVYFCCAHILFICTWVFICIIVYNIMQSCQYKILFRNIFCIQSGQFGILICIFHHSWIVYFFQWLFSGPVAFFTAAGLLFFQWLQWTSGLTCVTVAARALTLPVHVAFVMYRFYPLLLFSFVKCVHFDIFICIARHCHWTESIGLRFLPASLWLMLSFLEYSRRQGLSTDQCQNKQTNKQKNAHSSL